MPKKRKNVHGLEMRGEFGESIKIKIYDKGKVVHRETLKGTTRSPVPIKVALERKTELQQLYKTGQILPKQKSDMDGLANEFLNNWLSNKGRTGGFVVYERCYRLLLGPSLGRFLPMEISRDHITALINKLKISRYDRKSGKMVETPDNPPSRRNAEMAYQTLNVILNWAKDQKKIAYNPFSAMQKDILPKIDQPQKERLTHEEVQDILEEMKNTVFWLPAYFAALTGFRRNEILALRWKEVELDFLRVSAHFQLSKEKEDGEFKLIDLKGTHSYRTIGIGNQLAEKLREHKNSQATWSALNLGTIQSENDFVFSDDELKPLSSYGFSQAFRRAKRRLAHVETMEIQVMDGKAVELKKVKEMRQDVTLHDLRHYHASQLIKAKHDPKMVSRRMGHFDVAFTMRVYGNLREGDDKEAAEWLSNQLIVDAIT